MRNVMIMGVVCAATGCADEIGPVGPDAGDWPGERVTTERNDDGSYTTRVDARADDAWVNADVESGAEAAEGWDLGCQRYHIRLGAGARVAPLPGAAWDSVEAAPAEGWIADDGDDLAFERGDGWYAYDPATHVLTPRDVVWVVETGEGTLVKLMIEDYYDDAGTAGMFTWRWQPIGGQP